MLNDGSGVDISGTLQTTDVTVVTPLDWVRVNLGLSVAIGGALAFALGHKTAGYLLAGGGLVMWFLQKQAAQPATVASVQVHLPIQARIY
jgi:hypothetical protein